MAEHVVEVDVVEERVGVRDKYRMVDSAIPSRAARRRATVRAAAGNRRRLSQQRSHYFVAAWPFSMHHAVGRGVPFVKRFL